MEKQTFNGPSRSGNQRPTSNVEFRRSEYSSPDLDSFAPLPSRSPLPRGRTVHLVFPIPRLSGEKAIDKIDIMKFTKNIGMLLLAVYLIIDGLLGFGLNLGPAIFLLYIVALAAGIFILIGK